MMTHKEAVIKALKKAKNLEDEEIVDLTAWIYRLTGEDLRNIWRDLWQDTAKSFCSIFKINSGNIIF